MQKIFLSYQDPFFSKDEVGSHDFPHTGRQKRALDSRTRTTTSTRFSHRATLVARKPTSFWREKRDTVVILVRGFAKNVVEAKQVKNTVAVLPFFDLQKGSVTSNKNN